MTAGAVGRRQNPPSAAHSVSTMSPSTFPATDASARSPSRGGRSHRKVGGWEPVAPPPPTSSGGQLSGVRLSATRRCPSCWAPREGGPSAGPLGQGELLVASSSPHSCRVRPSAATAMMTLQWHGEAMTRTTPTCHSSPPPHWQCRRSTTAPATGLHRRRRHAPPPSAS
jgi:hypothetical protein